MEQKELCGSPEWRTTETIKAKGKAESATPIADARTDGRGREANARRKGKKGAGAK